MCQVVKNVVVMFLLEPTEHSNVKIAINVARSRVSSFALDNYSINQFLNESKDNSSGKNNDRNCEQHKR